LGLIIFSNQNIYNKKLKLKRELPVDYYRNPDIYQGIFKIDVKGSAVRGPYYSSWINYQELEKIEYLLKELKLDGKNTGHTIGIVTPFRAQKNKIEDMLINKRLQSEVTCGTAHVFQGDERDIMLFSAVVSRNMPISTINWVEKPHNLINVAVTRARDALYVIGDFDFCKQRKGILGKLMRYVENIEKVRKSSVAELSLYTHLGLEGLNPLVHPVICDAEVDFIIEYEGIKLVIEVDGKQHEKQKFLDESRDAMIRSKGYEVLRIKARDVLEIPNVVIEKIKNELGIVLPK